MDYDNKSKQYYNKTRPEMLQYLPESAMTVMEVGCGNGAFGNYLKQRKKVEVWGVEYVASKAAEAEKNLDRVLAGPIEQNLKELPDGFFDVVFFNDVLEHLVDPGLVLRLFKPKLSQGGVVISSIPNLRYHNALHALLVKKDFRYKDSGVMDFTHLRFFTKKSIRRMYEAEGFDVITHEGINRSRSLKPLIYNIPLLFTQMDIFYPQFATVAQLRSHQE